MSSPMVERVREIPLVVEREYPMESEHTGFPFDDDREDQGAPFRSQLDDIAARHPEFAQHLGSFPFRSGSRTRTQIPEHFTQQRFADRPFVDRFDGFGFPFDDDSFREEESKPYYQRYPKYYPKQNSQEETGEQSCSNQESQSTNSGQEGVAQQQEPERGRRPKQNIQQSNTVDLGQRQEPVDDRNQRSMSAPPPNNRTRFVSSINIPVNQPSEKANVAHETPQTSASSQPQERVIPIHVEGRDEPIIPKKFASQNTSQPQTHPQQPNPCTDKFFTQRSPNFPQYFQRDQPFQEWYPRGFPPKQQTQHTYTGQGQRGRSPQPKPEPAQPTRQAEPEQKQPSQVKIDTEESKPPEAPKQVSSKPDPIEQIKSIQRDVSELMGQVDQFSGKPRDKQYLYLDEMLTRNLIKLDNIDTQGQENIRQARKAAIKCIEKCISLLESKANANVEDKSKNEKEMEVEAAETVENKEMEVEESATGFAKDQKSVVVENVESTATPTGEKMEIESIPTEKPIETKTEDSSEQMDATPLTADSGSNKMVSESVEPQVNVSEVVQENKEMGENKLDQATDLDTNISEKVEKEVKDCEDKTEKIKTKKKVEKK